MICTPYNPSPIKNAMVYTTAFCKTYFLREKDVSALACVAS